MRAKPIAVQTRFIFPRDRYEGELTILPRYGQTSHPLHGHMFVGDEALPFTGQLDNLLIEMPPPSAPRGRPSKIARDIGVHIAYESLRLRAAASIGMDRGKRFASGQCLELWSRWPGIKDPVTLRRARRQGQKHLRSVNRGLLTYTGTAADMSDYIVVALLRGASCGVSNGCLRATGPIWVWRWGQQEAVHYGDAVITADVPDAAQGPLLLPCK